MTEHSIDFIREVLQFTLNKLRHLLKSAFKKKPKANKVLIIYIKLCPIAMFVPLIEFHHKRPAITLFHATKKLFFVPKGLCICCYVQTLS